MLSRFLFKSYKRFSAFRHWRKRHFTPAAMMVVSAFFFSFLLGFNIRRTTLYQVLAFSVSVMAVSMAASLVSFSFRVRIKRLLPDFVTIGDKVSYEIEITNLSSKTQKGLILYDDVKDPRPSFEDLLSKREPWEHLRNAWDRKSLYYRWQWLIQKARKARLAPIELPDLPAGETVRVRGEFVPGYRGVIYFTGATFARPDILGLFCRLCTIKKAQKLLVLPRRYRLETPDLASSRQHHPGGVNLASSIGNCDEFMSLRYYRPGDPLRNIHWRTFARTNELVIKEFEDEYFVRHALILDTFLTSASETFFEEAVSIASSYVSSVQTHESILDLMFVGKEIYSFSSGRGLGCPEKMLEILACVEPGVDKTVVELVPVLASNIKKISGSICIFMGWEAGHKKIYKLFKQANIPVFIIVIAEDRLKMEEKIFQDMEAAAHIKVVVGGQIEQDLGVL